MIPLSLLAGAVGIAGVGTLLATMSVNTRGKDFILAVLFVPLMYPLLLAAVGATAAAVISATRASCTCSGATMAPRLAAYDVIMLLAAFGLYEFVIGA